MGVKRQILVVEDDPVIGEALTEDLRREGYKAVQSTTLAQAAETFKTANFDLVVLDINLPDGNGLTLAKSLRNDKPSLPVVILTAQTDEETALQGLSLGAAEFLRKPFGRRELLARIGRLLKGKGGVLAIGDLEIRIDQRRVFVGKQEVVLTKTEFNILQKLMENLGDTVSREDLINVVRRDGDLFDSSLNAHLSRLRKKLSLAGMKEVKLESLYGNGYRLEKQ